MEAPMSAPLTPHAAKSRLGSAIRAKRPPEVITGHRRELAEANIAAAIDRALTTAPPLTDEQCDRLAARLRGA